MKVLGGCLLVLGLMASAASAGVVYDAANDYMAGWTGGSNPNGAWEYGWSTSPGNNLTLYSVHDQLAGFPNFDEWKDPSNNVLATPLVYSNQTGASFSGSGALDNVPAGALILHGGGLAAFCGSDGACFSEVIWTAPSTGNYDLASTFTGRQQSMDGLVEVLKITGGAPSTLFSNSALTDGVSQSFNQTISVFTGDQIIFAARTANGALDKDTTQLQATLSPSAVPEPATITLIGGALLLIGAARRRFSTGRAG